MLEYRIFVDEEISLEEKLNSRILAVETISVEMVLRSSGKSRDSMLLVGEGISLEV